VADYLSGTSHRGKNKNDEEEKKEKKREFDKQHQ